MPLDDIYLAFWAKLVINLFISSNLPLEEQWRGVKYAPLLQLRWRQTWLEFQTGLHTLKSLEVLLALGENILGEK